MRNMARVIDGQKYLGYPLVGPEHPKAVTGQKYLGVVLPWLGQYLYCTLGNSESRTSQKYLGHATMKVKAMKVPWLGRVQSR